MLTKRSDHAVVVAAAALVDAQGRVFMQQRPMTRDHGGLWEFPGGKLEPGEGPVAALLRELREELAIDVAPDALHPLGFAANEAPYPLVFLLYGCRTWSGAPLSQEAATGGWHHAQRLAMLAMPPLDVPLVPVAIRFAAT